MSRFLAGAFFGCVAMVGLATAANAATNDATAAAVRAPDAAVIQAAVHCRHGEHYIARHRHNGHWVAGYCTRNH